MSPKTDWESDVSDLLRRAEFGAAVQRLKDVPLDKRRVTWHSLALFAWRAAARSRGVPTSDTAQELLTLIDAGLRRYPASSRLTYLRACVLLDNIDTEEAKRVLSEAKRMALQNIQRDTTGILTEAEEKLVEEINAIEEGVSRWRDSEWQRG